MSSKMFPGFLRVIALSLGLTPIIVFSSTGTKYIFSASPLALRFIAT